MGFHVQWGSLGNKGFVTSGHCSYGSSTTWYMNNFGLVGAVVTGKNLFKDFGQDFMVVHLPDDANQVSRQIMDTTTRVSGQRDPFTGESICASLGMTDDSGLIPGGRGIDCGTVRHTSIS